MKSKVVLMAVLLSILTAPLLAVSAGAGRLHFCPAGRSKKAGTQ